jgi:hypothetical protein
MSTGPRFLAEAAAIVLVAVVTGAIAHLVWWAVAGCVLAVLAASFMLEAWLSRPAAPLRQAAAPSPPRPVESDDALTPHVRVLDPEPEPASPVEPVPPETDPEPDPLPVVAARGPWNLWEIERALRAQGGVDQERAFLLHYLRDYAGADGELPAAFDDLVRESFGDVLGAARA